MGMVRKGLALLRLLFVSPREFYERVSNLLEGRRQTRRFASGKGPRYSEQISFQEALRELSDIYRINLGDLFSEPEFAGLQKWVTQKISSTAVRSRQPLSCHLGRGYFSYAAGLRLDENLGTEIGS